MMTGCSNYLTTINGNSCINEWCLCYVTDRSYTVVSPAVCLEPGIEYTIRLELNRYKTNVETPDAALNVDSVSCNLTLKYVLIQKILIENNGRIFRILNKSKYI